MGRPFQIKCSNDGHYDQWTCPGCYADLPDKREGETSCPKCNRKLKLTCEEKPTCVSYLLDDEGNEL